MKSTLFFLSLSTALAICANANAAISIGYTDSPTFISVSEEDGEELDLSTFFENAHFSPSISEIDARYVENLKIAGNEDGTMTVFLNGFAIKMSIPNHHFNEDVNYETFLEFGENRDEYLQAVIGAYKGLVRSGLFEYDNEYYRYYEELIKLADAGNYDEVCRKLTSCESHGYSSWIDGFEIGDYQDIIENQDSGNQSESDNGGSDSNNSNQGSNNGEETNPDTGSSSGTGSSTGSGSGTISGSGSSTTGTTTMPTGHRTFYAPAEAAADVHEGKDNTVIISF